MRPLLLLACLSAAAITATVSAWAQEPPEARTSSQTPPQGPLLASPPAQDMDAVIPYDCNFAQKLTLGPAVCEERQALAIRRRIGEMIGKGRCDQAAAEARKTGDAAFTGRVQSACEERRARLAAAQH